MAHFSDPPSCPPSSCLAQAHPQAHLGCTGDVHSLHDVRLPNPGCVLPLLPFQKPASECWSCSKASYCEVSAQHENGKGQSHKAGLEGPGSGATHPGSSASSSSERAALTLISSSSASATSSRLRVLDLECGSYNIVGGEDMGGKTLCEVTREPPGPISIHLIQTLPACNPSQTVLTFLDLSMRRNF